MHQQVGGLLIGNLGNNSGNGSHSSPPIQHAGAEDTVHWQQQIVKYTVSSRRCREERGEREEGGSGRKTRVAEGRASRRNGRKGREGKERRGEEI